MKILHICPHLGGGVGTVIMGWMERIEKKDATIICLDTANEKARRSLSGILIGDAIKMDKRHSFISDVIENSDIALIHYWDHPILAELFSQPIPDCRLIFWCHQNFLVPKNELDYPDLFLDVSPIQGHERHIWSTGGVERFLKIKPKPHKGFNVGYIGTVDYKKLHPNFIDMCKTIDIPDVHFTVIGENNIGGVSDDKFTFTGKIDDVAPYLAEMDVFGYYLRPDHYGTSEQVLGEAMAAGVVPVVMNNPAEREIITNFLDGYIANSPKEYVSFIKSFYLKSPIGQETIIERTKERAKELYSLDTMIQKWDGVFTEIMKQPKRKRDKL